MAGSSRNPVDSRSRVSAPRTCRLGCKEHLVCRSCKHKLLATDSDGQGDEDDNGCSNRNAVTHDVEGNDGFGCGAFPISWVNTHHGSVVLEAAVPFTHAHTT